MEGIDPELAAAIRGAARQALSAGVTVTLDIEDLCHDMWLWYLERPSVQRRFAETEFPSARQRLFYRSALQLLSGYELKRNTFSGHAAYTAGCVREALAGRSTNKFLRAILPVALEDLGRHNPGYLEALRSRYEDGVVPQDKAGERRLYHAMTSLLGHVNVEYLTANKATGLDQKGWSNLNGSDVLRWTHRANPGARHSQGGYSDPTADVAIGLIRGGDNPIELHDGSTTTYREEVMQEGFDQTVTVTTDGQASPIGMPEGVFDPGFNTQDRADMYRAAVFPDLYPDEKPMQIHNWSAQDREEYCGGQFTPGYRRFSVVR